VEISLNFQVLTKKRESDEKLCCYRSIAFLFAFDHVIAAGRCSTQDDATRPAGDARRSSVKAKPNIGARLKMTDGQLASARLDQARCACSIPFRA
jgi:hypothetical protein